MNFPSRALLGAVSLCLFSQGIRADDQAVLGFSDSVNQFGAKTFSGVLKSEGKGKNVLISPLSAATVLNLTANGAQGETLNEMKKVLGSTTPANTEIKAYIQDLLATKTEEKISLANAIWVNKDRYDLSPAFAKTAQDFYAGKVKGPLAVNESFADNKTLNNINAWSKANTNGMIPKILEELEADSVAVLLNALFVQGQWAEPFSKHATKEDIFTSGDNKKTKVTYLNADEAYGYGENDDAQILTLGFRAGVDPKTQNVVKGRFAVDFVLPKKASAFEYGQKLSSADYLKMVKLEKQSAVIVQLPKFNISYSKVLNSDLEAQGMKKAFKKGEADFGALGKTKDGTKPFITTVVQKTAAEMDEFGFKAAAVTAVVVGTESVRVPSTTTFKATKPFLIYVRDTKTNTVLFQGIISNPAEK